MKPPAINAAIAAACLRAQLCPRCTLRVANVRSQSSYELPTHSIIRLHQLQTPQSSSPSSSPNCPTCLGILHDDSLDRIAAAVASRLDILSLQHNHGFKINASIPVSATIVRDRAMRIFLERNDLPTYQPGAGRTKRPRGNHSNSARNAITSCDSALHVSLREAVKWSACSRIQRQSGIQYSPDAEMFLDIIFTHPQSNHESTSAAFKADHKVRKRNRSDNNTNGNSNAPESTSHIARVMESMSTDQFVAAVGEDFIPPPPVSDPVDITAKISTSSILFAGNYNKYSRIVSQTPWFVDRPMNETKKQGLACLGTESVLEKERKTDEHGRPKRTEISVEEVVVKGILEVLKPEKSTFTAGGREDVDVRMLGSGRPFVVEVTNPSVVGSKITKEMTERIRKITARESSGITVNNLRIVPRNYFAQMRTYESVKRKCYRCVVWTSRACKIEELKEKLEVKGGFLLRQKTPMRVLHRRTQMVRERQIFEASVCRIVSSNFFVLDIVAAAGTYIKEFVHGDNGRTQPNVAQVLECEADILQLDVSEISSGSEI